jgi:hypothetical protein
MSYFNERDASAALNIVTPLIERILKKRWIRRRSFYLMISRREPDGKYTRLGEISFGNCDASRGYKFTAESNTGVCARTGLSSREVLLMRSDLMESFDAKSYGSVIQGDIIVAGSGSQPWVDEAIAKSCLAICMALIQQKIENQKENAGPRSTHFVW